MLESTKARLVTSTSSTKLLQKNHDQFDMFWKEFAGHNHTARSMLSIYVLGGTPEDLQ